jgi:hypothetical protein
LWEADGPDSKKSKALSEDGLRAWDAKGRVLLERLRAELGQEYVIGYMNETTGDVEWPA